MTPPLPEPMDPGRYRVALVCLGNICRSPTAEVVLSSLVTEAGLEDRVEIGSCGTASWHVGKTIDPRSGSALTEAGYDPSRHRARTFGPDWFEHDLLLAMDTDNLADVRAMLPVAERAMLFRAFDPSYDGSGEPPDVPDPYYGGPDGFADVLAMIERTSRVIVARLAGLSGQV